MLNTAHVYMSNVGLAQSRLWPYDDARDTNMYVSVSGVNQASVKPMPGPLTQYVYNKGRHISVLQLGKYPFSLTFGA